MAELPAVGLRHCLALGLCDWEIWRCGERGERETPRSQRSSFGVLEAVKKKTTLLRKGEFLGNVAGFSWCGMPTEDQPSKWQSKSRRHGAATTATAATLHIELRFESTTMEVLGNASGAQVGCMLNAVAIQVGNFRYSSCAPTLPHSMIIYCFVAARTFFTNQFTSHQKKPANCNPK